MNILGYSIYSTEDGGLWLSEDEKTWTSRFHEAASFTSYELAKDIAEREATSDETLYVMAVL